MSVTALLHPVRLSEYDCLERILGVGLLCLRSGARKETNYAGGLFTGSVVRAHY